MYQETSRSQKTINFWIFLCVFATGCGNAESHAVTDGRIQQTVVDGFEDVASARAQGYMLVPGGKYLHKSCVHALPEKATLSSNGNSSVIELADGSEQTVPSCGYAPVNAKNASRAATKGTVAPIPNNHDGWFEFSEATAPSNSGQAWFREIRADWDVPPDPVEDDFGSPVIFLFDSLQSNSWIIQPVLQWGDNGSFGGYYWTFASWFVDSSGDAWYSPPMTTQANNTIFGDVWSDTCSTAGRCNWHILAYDLDNLSQSTEADVDRNFIRETFNRADQGVLEGYDLDLCVGYPYATAAGFYNVTAWQPTAGNPNDQYEMYNSATWSASVWQNDCGERAVHVARGINLHFGGVGEF